jgi:hypothetical protein
VFPEKSVQNCKEWDTSSANLEDYPKCPQAAKGSFIPVQLQDSGAAEVRGHRIHVPSTCSELSELLFDSVAFLPGAVGSIPAIWSGVRYTKVKIPEPVGSQKDTYRDAVLMGWSWITPGDLMWFSSAQSPAYKSRGGKTRQETTHKLGSQTSRISHPVPGKTGLV